MKIRSVTFIKPLILAVSVIILIIGLFSPITASHAQAQGPVPAHHFWGKVIAFDGSDTSGLEVTAWINGEIRGSITTDQNGEYGCDPLVRLPYYLNVTGYSGDVIKFYIEGVLAEEIRFGTLVENGENRSWQWQELEPGWQAVHEAGEVNGLDLLYIPDGSGGSSDSGDNGGSESSGSTTSPPPSQSPSLSLKIELPGEINGEVTVDPSGFVTETITVSMPETMSLYIPKGVKAVDSSGNPLTSIRVELENDIALVTENNQIIGPVFKILPSLARFDPYIILTLYYTGLPENVDPENLTIAYYSESGWIPVKSIVDTKTKTVSAEIDHFSYYAILFFEDSRGEISTTVIEEEEQDEEKDIASLESDSEDTSASDVNIVIREDGPAQVITLPSEENGPVQWMWIAVIVGGLVLVGIIIYLLIKLSSYA